MIPITVARPVYSPLWLLAVVALLLFGLLPDLSERDDCACIDEEVSLVELLR